MSTATALSWLQHGAGYRAEVSADLFARVAPFGCSWSWSLVEGGVPAVSGHLHHPERRIRCRGQTGQVVADPDRRCDAP